jgi:hypothetical protein
MNAASILGLSLLLGAAATAADRPDDKAKAFDLAHLTPACEAGYRYGELFNAFDAEGLGALFAEDADYTGPDGQTQHGPQQIAARYASVLASYRKTIPEGTPATRVAQIYPQGVDDCLVEFEAWISGAYQLFAVDHFIVDRQGKISRFIPYIQTRVIPQLTAHLSASGKNM